MPHFPAIVKLQVSQKWYLKKNILPFAGKLEITNYDLKNPGLTWPS